MKFGDFTVASPLRATTRNLSAKAESLCPDTAGGAGAKGQARDGAILVFAGLDFTYVFLAAIPIAHSKYVQYRVCMDGQQLHSQSPMPSLLAELQRAADPKSVSGAILFSGTIYLGYNRLFSVTSRHHRLAVLGSGALSEC